MSYFFFKEIETKLWAEPSINALIDGPGWVKSYAHHFRMLAYYLCGTPR